MSIHVVKSEYNGHVEYHLRYPGMTKEVAQRLADRINGGALELADAIMRGQQHHSELCNQIFEAALKKGLIYNIGACGGGLPTFDAIVTKCLEAIEAMDRPAQRYSGIPGLSAGHEDKK